jgi:hypothetical protein
MTKWPVFALMGLALLLPGMAAAGVYTTSERFEGVIDGSGKVFADYKKFDDTVTDIRRVQIPELYSLLRQRALLATQLSEKAKGGSDPLGGRPANPFERKDLLTEQVQLLDVSAYYLMLDQPSKVIGLLTRDKLGSNFLLYANLGTALQMNGQYEDARLTLSTARSLWPRDWERLDKDQKHLVVDKLGWKQEHFDWYRRAEEFHFKLVLLRVQEQKEKKTGFTLDNLFGTREAPIAFGMKGGKYQGGDMAEEELKRLPKDALEIVAQLSLWLPNDDRITWLLAEILNAEGAKLKDIRQKHAKVSDARDILLSLKMQNKSSPEIRGHLRVLEEWVVLHRPVMPTPNLDQNQQDASNPLPPWQIFSVGMAVGIVVALLGYWQVREFVRPRQRQ